MISLEQPRTYSAGVAPMRLVKRSGLLLAAFAITVLSSVIDTHAQAPDCFGLRQADCKIVSAADTNVAKLTTSAYTIDMTATYDAGQYYGAFKSTGNGLYQGSRLVA